MYIPTLLADRGVGGNIYSNLAALKLISFECVILISDNAIRDLIRLK